MLPAVLGRARMPRAAWRDVAVPLAGIAPRLHVDGRQFNANAIRALKRARGQALDDDRGTRAVALCEKISLHRASSVKRLSAASRTPIARSRTAAMIRLGVSRIATAMRSIVHRASDCCRPRGWLSEARPRRQRTATVECAWTGRRVPASLLLRAHVWLRVVNGTRVPSRTYRKMQGPRRPVFGKQRQPSSCMSSVLSVLSTYSRSPSSAIGCRPSTYRRLALPH